MPGASPEQIEASIGKPLEESLSGLPGVKSIRMQLADGGFLIEVHFKKSAGEEQAEQIRKVVEGFWQRRSVPGDPPIVALDKASIF